MSADLLPEVVMSVSCPHHRRALLLQEPRKVAKCVHSDVADRWFGWGRIRRSPQLMLVLQRHRRPAQLGAWGEGTQSKGQNEVTVAL